MHCGKDSANRSGWKQQDHREKCSRNQPDFGCQPKLYLTRLVIPDSNGGRDRTNQLCVQHSNPASSTIASSRAERVKPAMRCYNCGSSGHLGQSCPKLAPPETLGVFIFLLQDILSHKIKLLNCIFFSMELCWA